MCWGVGGGKGKCGMICWWCGKCVGVWESMGRCGGWGVGVWKCVWGVGRGVERVLG